MPEQTEQATPLSADELETLRRIPTPALANAVETFNLRPFTEGFMYGEIHAMFPSLPPVAGYAVTARLVCAHEAGPRGSAPILEYWRYIEEQRKALGPLLLVLEDLDDPPALGTFIGEVNANVHKALGCVGIITNGGVRDLEEMEALGWPAWARRPVVSHGYSHIIDFGTPVRVGNLTVRPGDLLIADRHGVVEVPLSIARDMPEAVQQIEDKERHLISYCTQPGFTADGLMEHIRNRKSYH